jgi:hypothetical protein
MGEQVEAQRSAGVFERLEKQPVGYECTMQSPLARAFKHHTAVSTVPPPASPPPPVKRSGSHLWLGKHSISPPPLCRPPTHPVQEIKVQMLTRVQQLVQIEVGDDLQPTEAVDLLSIRQAESLKNSASRTQQMNARAQQQAAAGKVL